MENTKKITVAEQFGMVKAFLEENGAPSAMVEFIVDRAEKSRRKSSSSGKPTARQLENAELVEDIVDFMTENGGQYTVSDLIKVVPCIADLNTQRVTPMLKDARFKCEKIGKSNMYSLA